MSSDPLFADLVRQHIDLVYSIALRQMRDPTSAEDVTQAVFILLSKKLPLRSGSMTGWLVKATVYIAKNAKKIEARRRFHERQAGAMHFSEKAPVAASDDQIAELETAVARLPGRDRDAIVLRFFDSHAYARIGELMGSSEEAARKRIDRALHRLRKLLMPQTPLPSISVLATRLQQRTIHPASPLLRQAIQSGTGASANARLLAKHSARSSSLVLAKVAVATIALAVAVGTVAAVVIASKPTDQAATRTPLPSISIVTANQSISSEADRPGLVQVKRWDVILDPATAAVVKAAGTPITTRSRVYEAIRFSSDRLRQVVARAIDENHVLRISHQSEGLALEAPAGAGWGLTWSFSYTDDPSFFYLENEPQRIDEQSRQRQSPREAHLAFDRRLSVQVSQPYTNGTRVPAAAQFDGILIPGESVAFLGTFSDRHASVDCSHLVVFEAYAATPAEIAVMDTQHDTGWWCHNGPETMRFWADRELLWAKDAGGGRKLGPPSIEQKLGDGRSVWLAAFTRPSKNPLCWWDPAGMPLSNWQDAIPLDGDPPHGLWAQVMLSGTPSPESLQEQMSAQKIADEAKGIEVGVPTGDWHEVARIKPGGNAQAGTIRYELTPNPDNNFWLKLTERGLINNQTRAIVIEADGHRNEPRTEYPYFKWSQDRIDGTISMDVLAENGHPSEVIVEQRKREFVTFSKFATEPINPPPDLTRTQVDTAMEQMRVKFVQRALDAFPKHRGEHALGWFLGEPTDFNNAQAIFFHDAVAGDESAVRKMLTAKDALAVAALEPLAHLIVTGQEARRLAVRRFDEPTARTLLDRPGLFEDLLAELMDTGWQQLMDLPPINGKMGSDYGMWDDRSELLAWRLQNDATYRLNIDGLAQRKSLTVDLKIAGEKADRIVRLLKSATVGVDQIKAEVDR